MTVEETVGSLKALEERLRGQSEAVEGQLLLTAEEWSQREKERGEITTHERRVVETERQRRNGRVSKPKRSRHQGVCTWNTRQEQAEML